MTTAEDRLRFRNIGLELHGGGPEARDNGLGAGGDQFAAILSGDAGDRPPGAKASGRP